MKKMMTLAIVAHVDAGKTTLSEAMLYTSGALRKLGRVDRRDSFLDNEPIERERGITVFSKQAEIALGNTDITLLDTPGHAELVCETERALRAADWAVLVISGTDGVQAHTVSLWKLLNRYCVPSIVFVTKMDASHNDKSALLQELKAELSDGCVDFTENNEEIYEQLAMSRESAMEEYLDSGVISDETVTGLVRTRTVFPCFFGSGLKTDGVEDLLTFIDRFYVMPEAKGEFAARVFKIARDSKGNRLTFIKITDGSLKTKTQLSYTDASGNETCEKADELRIYSGMKYENVNEAFQGQICAVTGLTGTWPGLGLGAESNLSAPVMEPVMSYTAVFPNGESQVLMLPKLMQMAEEDPQLRVTWNSSKKLAELSLMGKMHAELITSLFKERFGVELVLDSGRVMYRETIRNKVEGIGHYEPLRHYAEVHLIMEPLPAGSGIVVDSICSEDELDRNWQRLILSHVLEKNHLGVLTGSPVTDIKITLAAGKAHIKHTEGGDFRQATYRAVRQGLMKAESILLEPWYSFEISAPPEYIGRAIGDIRAMHGEFSGPEDNNGSCVISGFAPVSLMNGYSDELASYTHGVGKISLRAGGFRPCRNWQEIAEKTGYNPLADMDNSPDSVFCSHGAGTVIPWNEVENYMHLETCLVESKEDAVAGHRAVSASMSIDDRELEEIMLREFGPIRRKAYSAPVVNSAVTAGNKIKTDKSCIILDGYNVIFAWKSLKTVAEKSLDLARRTLADIISNYSAFTGSDCVIVFDGFRTPGNPGSKSDYENIRVVYTRDGETADAYIEKIASEIGKNYSVRVITADNLIRLSALRSGVLGTKPSVFEAEVSEALRKMNEVLEATNRSAHKVRIEDGKK